MKYLRFRDLSIPATRSRELEIQQLEALFCRRYKLQEMPRYQIRRRSIDARRELRIRFVIDVEASCFSNSKRRGLLKRREVEAADHPSMDLSPVQSLAPVLQSRPVIVGMGPAGLFAALYLCERGCPPIILERGKAVEDRSVDFERLCREGRLDPESNAQYGEGGAGTFSDGKLTTRIHDQRIHYVLESLVRFGADERILYEQRPHIGSDRLPEILKALRAYLREKGAEIRFSTRVSGLNTEAGRLVSLDTSAGLLACQQVILATGHSARNEIKAFHSQGLALENKAFAMGFRIEHDQEFIDRCQYGDPEWAKYLGAASYQVTVHPEAEHRQRAIYSFCMCPGGEVICSSSDAGRLCINGMSREARNTRWANAAILCTVDADDYGSTLFAGMDLQEEIERRAYALGGGDYAAPYERVDDFLYGAKPAQLHAANRPLSYRPALRLADLSDLYPARLTQALKSGLLLFNQKIKNFSGENAFLIGAETRSSATVRIIRDSKSYESVSISGLYPAGEGAGYAGGIVSSAVDGLRSAERLLDKFPQSR